MKLAFSLLVVDDAPESIEQAIGILKEHLEAKGFTLETRFEKEFSEKHLKDLALSEGRNYDLVIVDYNLGQHDMNGTAVAHRLRRDLPYTDMVFYSSNATADLLGELAQHQVSGVFAERREDLDGALTSLADTVIGKAVDINHMRGIGMAKVAEMDVLMEETLTCVFRSTDKGIIAAGKRTIEKLREDVQGSSRLLERTFSASGLIGVVSNSLLFSSAKKYQAIRRVVQCLPGKPAKELEVLRSYEDEIIQNRNMLAHVKEDFTDDDKPFLRSIKSNEGRVIINDDWMADFRVKLNRHRSALDIVCRALNGCFGGGEAPGDPDKQQP